MKQNLVHSKQKLWEVFKGSSIKNILHNMIRDICIQEAEYEGKESGWTLYHVDGIHFFMIMNILNRQYCWNIYQTILIEVIKDNIN